MTPSNDYRRTRRNGVTYRRAALEQRDGRSRASRRENSAENYSDVYSEQISYDEALSGQGLSGQTSYNDSRSVQTSRARRSRAGQTRGAQGLNPWAQNEPWRTEANATRARLDEARLDVASLDEATEKTNYGFAPLGSFGNYQPDGTRKNAPAYHQFADKSAFDRPAFDGPAYGSSGFDTSVFETAESENDGGFFSRYKRFFIVGAILLVLLSALGFYGIDTLLNLNTIHSGVTVSGVDVGNMTVDEAANILDVELVNRADAEPVNIFAAADLVATGVNENTLDFTEGVTAYDDTDFEDEEDPAQSWSISGATLSVDVDGQKLAEQAYAVGRGSDFLLGRLKAVFSGVEIAGTLEYEPAQLSALKTVLTRAAGWETVNADIRSTDKGFVVEPGKDGLVVDHDAFVSALDAAYLGQDRTVVVSLVPEAQLIDEEKAEYARQWATEATSEAVNFVPADVDSKKSWPADGDVLRGWVSTTIKPTDAQPGDEAELVAFIDEAKVSTNFEKVVDIKTIRVKPKNAHFEVDENGEIEIIDAIEGAGVDYEKLSQALEETVFGPHHKAVAAAKAAESGTNGNGDGTEDNTENSTTSSDTQARTNAHTSAGTSASNGAASNAASTSSGAATRDIVIPIGTLQPKFTTEDAQALRITDKISSFTTTHSSPETRAHNIKLACDFINGTLIAPGDTWSFHETVGDPTTERGFQMDRGIAGNEFVDAIGGGVCQVATTIFNAAYESGLPIEERTNHALYLSNYPDGRDAAVSFPSPDLKFTNDTPDWMVLTIEATDDHVTATLWGTDPGYKVETKKGAWAKGTKYKTKKVENNKLYEDEEKVKTKGVNGSSISVTRLVYDRAGKLIRETVFSSRYRPIDEVIEVGTKPRPPKDDDDDSDTSSKPKNNDDD
ncbi:MAG: VanW family protein [Coriobacteriia bacterium]|nr:VanW family protein [Coriobacteriia bacterium]